MESTDKNTKKDSTSKIGWILLVAAAVLFAAGVVLARVTKDPAIPTDPCIGCGVLVLLSLVVGLIALVLILLGLKK